VERSLKRLGRDQLDVYLLHNPSLECLLAGEVYETLELLKKDGKIGHHGISTADPEAAMNALDRGIEVLAMPYKPVSLGGPAPGRG